MHPDDAFYFRKRAEQQLRLAKRARHPEAAKAHYVLAGFYFDRFYSNRLTRSKYIVPG